MEVLKEKFDQKDIEIEGLIMRMAESAEENANLQEEIRLYDIKLQKKTQYINELKERSLFQKTELEDLQKSSQT
jgi:hypothetical protein